MAQLPKVQRRLVTTEAPRSSVSAETIAAPYAMLGRALGQLGEGVDSASVVVGEQEGQRAVARDADGNLTVETMPAFTGRAGIAHNRAAKHSFLAQTETEIQRQVATKGQEFDGRPQEFQDWGSRYIEELVGRQDDPAIQDAVRLAATRQVDDKYRGLSMQRHRLDQQRAQQAIDARLLTLSDEMEILARNNGADTDGFRQRFADFDALLNEKVNNPSIAFPREKADRFRDEVLTRAHGAAILEGVERTYRGQGFEAARTVLRDSVRALGATLKQGDKIERQGLAWLRTEEAGYRGERVEIRREWSAAKPLLETLSPETLDDMEQRAYAVGAHQTGRDIRMARVSLDIARELRGLPKTEQVEALRTGNASVSSALVNRIVGAESGGNPDAQPPVDPATGRRPSTATGAGQFIQGTWLDLMRRHKPDLVAGKSDSEILDMRRDGALSREMVGVYAGENGERLRAAGVRADDGALYLAHFLGAGDAIKVLSAPAGQPVEGLITPASVAANKGIFARNPTAGAIADWATRKVSGAGGQAVNLSQSREGMLALGMIRKDLQKDLTQRITDLTSAVKRQELPDVGEIETLGAEIEVLGTPAQKQQVAELAAIAQYGERFSQLSQAQRSEVVSQWQARMKEGAPEFERTLAETVRSADAKISEAYRKDRYGAWWRYAEGAQPTPALDFSQPQQAARVVAERVKQQHSINADQGMEPGSVVRPSEEEALRAVLTHGPAEGAAAALGALGGIVHPGIREATLTSPPIREALQGMARSNDPLRLTAGMSTLDRVWRENPQTFAANFGGDTLKRLQAWQSWKDTLSGPEIVEQINRADDPSSASARKSLGEAADDELSRVKAGDVVSFFKGSWVPFTGPNAPVDTQGVRAVDNLQGERLVADYQRHYKALREVNVPADQAQQRAVERLRSEWSQSTVNGGALMRHAPERYYDAVDGGHAWMRPQIDALIASVKGGEAAELNKTKLGLAAVPIVGQAVAVREATRAPTRWTFRSLVPDAQTEAEIAARRPPSYRIIVTDTHTGRDDILVDASGRDRFAFDPTEANAESDRRFAAFREGRAVQRELDDPRKPFGVP